jgi:hypothetical protein
VMDVNAGGPVVPQRREGNVIAFTAKAGEAYAIEPV